MILQINPLAISAFFAEICSVGEEQQDPTEGTGSQMMEGWLWERWVENQDHCYDSGAGVGHLDGYENEGSSSVPPVYPLLFPGFVTNPIGYGHGQGDFSYSQGKPWFTGPIYGTSPTGSGMMDGFTNQNERSGYGTGVYIEAIEEETDYPAMDPVEEDDALLEFLECQSNNPLNPTSMLILADRLEYEGCDLEANVMRSLAGIELYSIHALAVAAGLQLIDKYEFNIHNESESGEMGNGFGDMYGYGATVPGRNRLFIAMGNGITDGYGYLLNRLEFGPTHQHACGCGYWQAPNGNWFNCVQDSDDE